MFLADSSEDCILVQGLVRAELDVEEFPDLFLCYK